MGNSVKECKVCGRTMLIAGRGMCGKCYAIDRKTTPLILPPVNYLPIRKVITIWETTDGKEFGNEVDALRHQIDLNYEKRR